MHVILICETRCWLISVGVNCVAFAAIHALRLDSCVGVGTIRLESFQFKDSSGKVVHQWP